MDDGPHVACGVSGWMMDLPASSRSEDPAAAPAAPAAPYIFCSRRVLVALRRTYLEREGGGKVWGRGRRKGAHTPACVADSVNEM